MTRAELVREVRQLRSRLVERDAPPPEMQTTVPPQQLARQRALLAVVSKIRESLDLESIFKSTATEVQQLLNADRVGMYRFDPDSHYEYGEFVSEAVRSPFPSALTARIRDRCFGSKRARDYHNGRIWACSDIYEQNLRPCHIEILEQFQVRANLVVPLIEGDRLWGLLCIHQCCEPRAWQASDIDFVSQIAGHLGIALQHAEFVAQLQDRSDCLAVAVRQAVEREKAVAAIIDKIRRSLNLDTIFHTTTAEVRDLLHCDRVTIYRFNPDWSGEFLVESVANGWASLLDRQQVSPELCANISECSLKYLAQPVVADTYLQDTQGGDFARGEVFRVCHDIYSAGFSDCYLEALERYQAKAYAIIAIYKGQRLWGLLAAFSNGQPRQWQDEEVQFLSQIGAQLGVAIQQAELLAQVQNDKAQLQTALTTELRRRADELAADAERERAIAEIVDKIRRTLDLETIFRTATTEVRQLLDADRVAVFCFDENALGEGHFVSEDVVQPFVSALNIHVRDSCFSDRLAQDYQQGRMLALADVRKASLSDCHLKLLERFQIRASLVLPLLEGTRLWGLLCVHHCRSPRQWQVREIEFVRKISVQLGVGLQQAQLLTQAQNRAQELQEALAQVQAQKEEQAKAAAQERALARTIERIRQTLDIDTIFSATTQDVRQILQCDRVAVYRFLPDWSGEFVFESEPPGAIALATPQRKLRWADSYLQDTQGGRYRNRETLAIADIEREPHTECYRDVLRQLRIRAYAIAPVFVGDTLWGLLAAYQNNRPRRWVRRDIDLLAQVGSQLGVALQQAELLGQLQEAKEHADAANRAKTEFLAHMSHELRTPLNAILGFTQVLLRDRALERSQREHLEVIGRSGEYLLTLLNDVLEMSKIEAGQLVLNPSSFDLARLLSSLEEMLELRATSKGLQLQVVCDENVPQAVRTDENKLHQVLMNLLGNAIKFTQQGRVCLRVCLLEQVDDRATVQFDVSDTGPGIAPEELESLFEAFVQTETGRRSQEGTGLGLPISQRFVNLMGGSITVESELGRGSCFRFALPVTVVRADGVTAAQPARRAIALAPEQPEFRILVVDDKADSRAILRSLLEPMGFAVREAHDGSAAIELWERWQPDLIWMDMRMPGTDGYSATREIRRREAAQPTRDRRTAIVALTATVFDRQPAVVLDVGCDDFVSKPFRDEVIFEKMRQYLGVRYVYEADCSAAERRVAESPLDSSRLAALPQSWLVELHQAALSAREKLILQAIAQLPPNFEAVATGLRQLCDRFLFDRIVDLVEPLLDNPTDTTTPESDADASDV